MPRPSPSLGRALLALCGAVLLLFGGWFLLAPRARFAASDPLPGATVSLPPPAVTVRFDSALDPRSTIEVLRTIAVSASGDTSYPGGERVSTGAGLDPADAGRRTLRAALAPGLSTGLYVVRWTALAARGGSERFGTLYFGAGMPVPEHITRDMPGALRERDYQQRGRRSTLLGGVILVALAALLPRLPRRR